MINFPRLDLVIGSIIQNGLLLSANAFPRLKKR